MAASSVSSPSATTSSSTKTVPLAVTAMAAVVFTVACAASTAILVLRRGGNSACAGDAHETRGNGRRNNEPGEEEGGHGSPSLHRSTRRVEFTDEVRRRRDDGDSSSIKDDDDRGAPRSKSKSLPLDPGITVAEANRRRTASYLDKERRARTTSASSEVGCSVVVRGVVGPHERLVDLRRVELGRILALWNEGTKSHRTIVAMCDGATASLLADARERILAPLRYDTDPSVGDGGDDGVRGGAPPRCWIPEVEVIPEADMHVTIAKPWGRHVVREGNYELSKELASRFHQTLLLKFHHPFQIELERIILLGGNNLVALWRCVGERIAEDGSLICDRHGEGVDPTVRLREEIVRCYTTESPDGRRQPLTYASYMQQRRRRRVAMVGDGEGGKGADVPSDTEEEDDDPSSSSSRRHTVITNTPGVGGGSRERADGFVHTTLCRLPLHCLSDRDVDLGPVHDLCADVGAELAGHRMVVSRYRFLESMGEGGRNPCVNPIYDETFDAPVDVDGGAMGIGSCGGVALTDNVAGISSSDEKSGNPRGAVSFYVPSKQ